MWKQVVANLYVPLPFFTYGRAKTNISETLDTFIKTECDETKQYKRSLRNAGYTRKLETWTLCQKSLKRHFIELKQEKKVQS